MRITIRLLFLLLWVPLCLLSCDRGEQAPPKAGGGAPAAAAGVTVEVAPFNRFPSDKLFPIAFRFSHAVGPFGQPAPSGRIALTPAKFGWWKWESESELRFYPNDPWTPGEKVSVDLGSLFEKSREAVQFSPAALDVTLPAAHLEIVECGFREQKGPPIVRAPFAKLRANYPKELKEVLAGSALKLKKTGGKGEEQLTLSGSESFKGLDFELAGPQMFRPDGEAEIVFETAGARCSAKVAPPDWNPPEPSKAVKTRPLTAIRVTAPLYPIGADYPNRNPVQLAFVSGWDQGSPDYVPTVVHGKPAGSVIESAITLSPPLKGEWKAADEDPSLLSFVPADEWPVGQIFIVTFDPNSFPDVALKDASTTFRSPELTVSINEAELYTDPAVPSSRKIVASIQSNVPLKDGEVERLTRLRMRVEPTKNYNSGRDLTYTAERDKKDKTLVYIRSEEFQLPDEPGEVRLSIERGLEAQAGGTASREPYSRYVSVPSKKEMFRIVTSQLSVVTQKEDALQRVLSLEVSEPVKREALLAALEAFVLPDCGAEENAELCKNEAQFGDEARITKEVLARSEQIGISPLERDEKTAPNMFPFELRMPLSKPGSPAREVFIRVKSALISDTGFSLAKEYRTVLAAEPFPRLLSIMHDGSLLSLSGSRKLGVALRNVDKVEFELARVLPRDVHHLVSVTYGNMAEPSFNYGSIQLDQLAERKSYLQNFPEPEPGKTHYSVVDFDRFTAAAKENALPRGLFLLTVREKVEEKKKDAEESTGEGEPECEDCGEGDYESPPAPLEDKRLVLLTDLGILAKDELSGAHEVFVLSFRTGAPVPQATVKLVGQNGEAVFSALSDQEGRVSFPATDDLNREKRPLMYSVEKGGDYSFLPFRRNDRQVNVSRFDTGGVINKEESEGLRAMLFTDRSLYRPGEEARIGIIVRKRNLDLPGAELPLELTIRDPRGIEILKRKLLLSRLGFEDFRWSSEGAPTGTFWAGLSLVRSKKENGEKEKKRMLLGSTSFRVDEFQPDKLAVKSRYLAQGAEPPAGWAPRDGAFEVSVQNLFGTPAVGNKVSGTLLFRPWDGSLPTFPGFRFYTEHSEDKLPSSPESLGEVDTDEKGIVSFRPELERFSEKALRLEFAAEAFEKDSGRSVVSTAATLVSSAPGFLGWKADGSLEYISKGSERKIALQGVNPAGTPIEIPEVKLTLERIDMVSVLVKQPNGTLRYQLTPKKSTVWTGTVAVPEAGTAFALHTSEAGAYSLLLADERGGRLGEVPYVVFGEGNTTFAVEKPAEVGIRLKNSDVLPGDELEVSVNTPYTGTGLLTIERDKVYAAKWFKSDTLSSVQTIRVPEGVVGNAYVSVAFVRSLDSKDIFMAPMSYGVRPFSISRSEYTAGIKLDAPEKIQPGGTLPVQYRIDEPGSFLLYAVDEGILQFAKYRNPEPVSNFVPKRALEVSTYQILDLLLPDYKLVESLSSPGGDEDAGLGKFKNPFARRRKAPVAFWSGILPDNTLEGTIDVPVPEYFNGTLRIIALAVGERKVGVASRKSVVQSDFVVQPALPYFVSPGDEFEASAVVANTVAGSGRDVKLSIEALPSAGLELVEGGKSEILVPEGQDTSVRLRLRAKEALGEQEIKFIARGLGKESSASETISLRPAMSFRTGIQGGFIVPEKPDFGELSRAEQKPEKTLTLQRDLFPERRDVIASVSETPLSIGRAFVGYLKSYPYGCTEQLVSAAMPGVLFGADRELSLDENDVQKFAKKAFQALSARQRADGSFGVWDITSEPDPVFTVYAAHFLRLAEQRGLEVPSSVLTRSGEWLKSFGAEAKYDLSSHFAQAYALYVRATSGEVVGKEATAFAAEMDRQWKDLWRQTPIALFLAGAFKVMEMDQQATALLKAPPQVWKSSFAEPAGSASVYGSVYSLISSKHFPESTWLSPQDSSVAVLRMIEEKDFNSFTSAFALLGLDALGDRSAAGSAESLEMKWTGSGAAEALALEGARIRRSAVPLDAKSVTFSGKEGQTIFYELSESGFDRGKPKPISSGIKVSRELRNEKGDLKMSYEIDEKLDVKIFIQSDTALESMAIVELVPGGFEIDLSDEGLGQRRSLSTDTNTWRPDFIEIQEDRILFFGDLPEGTATFVYRLKPVSRGKFSFAPAFAEGMYDSTKQFLGEASVVEVK